MPSMREVPVFYLDQDTSWEQPCKIVQRDDARALKAAGLGKFVDHGTAFRLFEASPIIQSILEAEDEAALKNKTSDECTCTISLSEMLANVGICEENAPDPRGQVKRAQEKIIAYPGIFDQYATLAQGRWAQQPVAV